MWRSGSEFNLQMANESSQMCQIDGRFSKFPANRDQEVTKTITTLPIDSLSVISECLATSVELTDNCNLVNYQEFLRKNVSYPVKYVGTDSCQNTESPYVIQIHLENLF